MTSKGMIVASAFQMLAVLAQGCLGGECGYSCDSILRIVALDLPADSGPLSFEVCDGAYCAAGTVAESECFRGASTAAPPSTGQWQVCYASGAWVATTQAALDIGVWLPNNVVRATVRNAAGEVLAEGEGTPVVSDNSGCDVACEQREFRL